MKKIIFKGLGPTGNVVYKDKQIEDGAIVEMEEEIANAYIKAGFAHEIIDKNEAIKIQNQVLKNKARREEIIKTAEEKKIKKGGSK